MSALKIQVSLEDLKTFSKCPAYYSYTTNTLIPITKKNKDISLCENVMKKAYIRAMETSFKAKWKDIINWTDQSLFSSTDFSKGMNEEISKKIAKSKESLNFLRIWYNDLYLKQDIGYPSIKIEENINHIYVYDEIPFTVLSSDQVFLLSIGEIDKNIFDLVNDIRLRGQASLIYNKLGIEKISILYIKYTTSNSLNKKEVILNKEDNIKMNNHLFSLVQGLKTKSIYPSVSKQCNQCIFKRRCKL